MATTTNKKSTKKPTRTTTKKAVSTSKTTKKRATTKPTKKTTVAAVAKPVQTEQKLASATPPEKKAVKKAIDTFTMLFRWNWAMALLHAAQGVAVVVLSRDALFPVTTSFITLDSVASTDEAPVLTSAIRTIADVNLAYVIAAFFFMSAIAHLTIVTIYKKKYVENLKLGINKARWYEYGISASTMMLGIAMLSGVSDLSTLMMIFGTTLVMNLLGLVMEIHNQTTTKTNWISYVVGTISGLLPWFAIGIYFWGSNQYGDGQIPTFVYYIYASIFVFFSSFAINMWLQYTKKGKWADYIYGEKAYMVLSLVAKSALAWQVFGGTLRP